MSKKNEIATDEVSNSEPWYGHRFYKGRDGRWRCFDGCGPVLVEEGSTPEVSEHVRKLIGRIDQFRMCMSYNESYFGEPAGLLKGVFAELGHAVNPIYPDGKTALYPDLAAAPKKG